MKSYLKSIMSQENGLTIYNCKRYVDKTEIQKKLIRNFASQKLRGMSFLEK